MNVELLTQSKLVCCSICIQVFRDRERHCRWVLDLLIAILHFLDDPTECHGTKTSAPYLGHCDG